MMANPAETSPVNMYRAGKTPTTRRKRNLKVINLKLNMNFKQITVHAALAKALFISNLHCAALHSTYHLLYSRSLKESFILAI